MDRVTVRPGGRSARIRAAVLEAALAELAERGDTGISLEAVAARAGVHKSTIYRRWGTPSALVLDALLERSDATVEVADEGTLGADLRRLLEGVRANLSDPAGRSVAVATVADRDDAAREGAGAFWADRLARAAVIVERAIARGELPDDLAAAAVVELAVAPLFFRVLVRHGEVDDALIDQVIEVLVAGSRRP
ncbi:MAG TPA: TetR-like C-terminal domain-containing protein [Acidimicrobiales bacterium]|nr:TetR-like C-terminal domain-containing protein [Acidimicrobiales bacterium]